MENEANANKVYKINIQNISKAFRKKSILSNVSLTLKAGECVGIIGMNGSGKPLC